MPYFETGVAVSVTVIYFFAARGFGTWLLGARFGRYFGLGIGVLVGALTLGRHV